MGRLTGKTALITAAGQGIGRATVEAYVAEGAKVFAADINEAALETLGALEGVTALKLDVTDGVTVKEALSSVGTLDILFNCAGFVHSGTILECDEDAWDFSFNLNAKAMYRLCRGVIPAMLENGAGPSSICRLSRHRSKVFQTGLPIALPRQR